MNASRPVTEPGAEDFRMSIAELHAAARERFGDDPADWAFICPRCGDVATPKDFMALGGKGEDAGSMCIGRVHGSGVRGCDWAAFGLFRGPMLYLSDSGEELPGFKLAPSPASPEEES